MLSLFSSVETYLCKALERSLPDLGLIPGNSCLSIDPQLVSASKPEFGDFQANCALSLAKKMKRSPRDIANAIVEQLEEDDDFLEICEIPKIAGPGFINLTIRNECLIKELKDRLGDDRLGVPHNVVNKGKDQASSVVVDFSSPNIAKEMHVGHLRSTIIGDCLSRVLEFLGHSVVRVNHVGDWGTQFGMLITHLNEVSPQALHKADSVDLGDLVAFYREAKKRFDDDEHFRTKSRHEVVKLQGGDLLALKAWQLLCDQSRREFQKIYDRLNISIHERGESFYNPYLKSVVDELTTKHLVVTDQGAKCVFLQEKSQDSRKAPPVIVQKKDGGFNYATTDLAALRYRFKQTPEGDGATRVIYVTDAGQANHFDGVFQVAQRANWIPEQGRVQHVPFGLVLGDDGKKLKTRSGETVRLCDLLDEAVDRAKIDLCRRLNEEGREEDQAFINKVSTTVGLASVKYADLSQNRITNYQFSFDRMLSLQGNTAPYLLYACVRISGIARKGGDLETTGDNLSFCERYEWDLVRQILKFDEIIIQVEEELLPNRLCNYLFELSQVFNRFYDQVPVLKAEQPFRNSRLVLCRLTAETLRLGLGLLGIPTLDRM